jgi:uncharacterized protein YycO
MKTLLSLKSRAIGCLLVGLILLSGAGKGGEQAASTSSANQAKPSSSRQIVRWLDYDFDETAPMGSAKNPAIILPAELTNLLGNLPGVKRQGENVFIPAAEFKKAAAMPFAGAMLSPVISQLSNIKSFDGFSAVDGTGLIKKVPSLLNEPDTIGRRLTGENPQSNGRLLQNGDLVFGSHVINFMTWGRYNHVAIVTDATQGLLVEATAEVPSDKPGVRSIDWKSFASTYVHVGIVRVKGVQPNQLARVIRWVEDRKGKPYRWPIIMGLDTSDESRFYCSQLVWLAYKNVLNIDLDNDQGVLIFPDDLYESSDVEKIVP